VLNAAAAELQGLAGRSPGRVPPDAPRIPSCTPPAGAPPLFLTSSRRETLFRSAALPIATRSFPGVVAAARLKWQSSSPPRHRRARVSTATSSATCKPSHRRAARESTPSRPRPLAFERFTFPAPPRRHETGQTLEVWPLIDLVQESGSLSAIANIPGPTNVERPFRSATENQDPRRPRRPSLPRSLFARPASRFARPQSSRPGRSRIVLAHSTVLLCRLRGLT